MNLTGWQIRCDLRNSLGMNVIQPLTAVFTNAATGVIRLTATAVETVVWSKSLLALDIRLTNPNGVVVISETVNINVVERITQ